MKSFIPFLFLILTLNVHGQDCINFSQYDQPYLDSVNFEPQGTTVFSQGNLSIIKGGIPCYFLSVQGDTLTYMGNITLDVSTETCTNKQLTFKCVYLEGLAVDGDTLFSSLNPPVSYFGAGFTFESVNYGSYIEYTITGDFNMVDLLTQTNFLWDVCLDCAPLGGGGCIDFTQYTQPYLDSVNFEPQGTTVFTQGTLSVVKGDVPCYFLGIQGDTLNYIGNITLDASAETCSGMQLTFKCVYLEGLVVDGDTIFSSLNPPASYNGAGFTFESINNGSYTAYTITGDFDYVELLTQTNMIWDICLACAVGLESITDPIQLKLYPNPVNDGSVTIESSRPASYHLYSIEGFLMQTGSIYSSVKLDVTNYSPGIYLIVVTDESGRSVTKKMMIR